MTFSITTISIMTLSIKGLFVTINMLTEGAIEKVWQIIMILKSVNNKLLMFQ